MKMILTTITMFLGIDEDEEKVPEDSHNELFKFANVGAGIGRGFLNTQEL